MIRSGANGSVSVEIVISGAMRGICFVFSNCHFILLLFVVGNIVREVEYVSRM